MSMAKRGDARERMQVKLDRVIAERERREAGGRQRPEPRISQIAQKERRP